MNLTKQTVGQVHITLCGTAKDDRTRLHNLARATFWATPDARPVITNVRPESGPYNGTVYTVTGYLVSQ